jgi:hypothetical protein
VLVARGATSEQAYPRCACKSEVRHHVKIRDGLEKHPPVGSPVLIFTGEESRTAQDAWWDALPVLIMGKGYRSSSSSSGGVAAVDAELPEFWPGTGGQTDGVLICAAGIAGEDIAGVDG